MSESSTGYHGDSGIHPHNISWVHYKAPARGSDRYTHTQYVFNDADREIRRAAATKGAVSVSAVVHSKQTQWYCSRHRGIVGTGIGNGPPGRQGCRGGAEHDWSRQRVWIPGAVTSKTLHYDKGGPVVRVSLHAF